MYGPFHWHPFARGGLYGRYTKAGAFALSVVIGGTVYFTKFNNDAKFASPLTKRLDEDIPSAYRWFSDRKNTWLDISDEEIKQIKRENEVKREKWLTNKVQIEKQLKLEQEKIRLANQRQT